ncbi:cyclic lactone autoinducer peptide [Petroclostridium sp. X23]|nr:cyclic lactone autoinducer peptide [Petroclostridium sp. X23]WHH56953.1 cyclic lactone autoinducer peptide [Petroclostridium sp. X23]
MINRFKKFVLSNAAAVIAFVAMIGVGANSIWYFYEPKIPESLKNRKQ